ncbi:MAG: hypothetical protein QM585_08790, partial [Enterobacter sp.]
MPKNEFLTFGTEEGANTLTPDEYEAMEARGVGFVSGVAKSRELNTVWRQASVIASVFAQYIANRTGKDVLDNGDINALNQLVAEALNAVQSVNGEGPDENGNVQLGSVVDADIVTSMTDTTAGRVPVVGWMGPGGSCVRLSNAELMSAQGFGTSLFAQGNSPGADDHFGAYGCGVHMLYGKSGDG